MKCPICGKTPGLRAELHGYVMQCKDAFDHSVSVFALTQTEAIAKWREAFDPKPKKWWWPFRGN